MRVWFWFSVLDVIVWSGGFGGRAYHWALRRAAGNR